MKFVSLNKDEVLKLNDILEMENIDFEKENIKEDSIIFEKAINFEDNLFALIQVCTGQNNAYINAVLIKEGYEVDCLTDADGPLNGEYTFNYEDKNYIVNLTM